MGLLRYQCTTCGGDLRFDNDSLHAVCAVCGNHYYFKEEKAEALVLSLNAANEFLKKADFEE